MTFSLHILDWLEMCQYSLHHDDKELSRKQLGSPSALRCSADLILDLPPLCIGLDLPKMSLSR